MADLLQSGAAWLAGKLGDNAAQTITYARGAATVSLAAALGRSEHQQERADGAIIAVVAEDFIVQPASLVLSGAVATPARGDRITLTIGSATRTYEVMDIPGVGCFEADPWNSAVRIHTKRLS